MNVSRMGMIVQCLGAIVLGFVLLFGDEWSVSHHYSIELMPAKDPTRFVNLPLDLSKFIHTDAVETVFGDCGKPLCHITYSPGGYEDAFLLAAEEISKSPDRSAEIDGDCYSACTVFAAAARDRVCLTKNARMIFHKAYRAVDITDNGIPIGKSVIVAYEDPVYPDDLKKWFTEGGGLPREGWTVMTRQESAHFFRQCDLDSPLPRPDPRRQ